MVDDDPGPRPPGGWAPRAKARTRPEAASTGALRLLVAAALAAGFLEIVWHRVPRQLSVRTNVIGSTTFRDFDILRYHYAFDLIAVAFPVLTALLYLAASRWGPLRTTHPAAAPWPPALIEAVEEAANPPAPVIRDVGTLARVLLPAAVIALEVSTADSPRIDKLTTIGVVAGIAYVAFVAAVAGLHTSRRSFRHVERTRANTSFPVSVDLVNAYATVVVVPLLYAVSRQTTMRVRSTGEVVHYPWLPLWLVVLLSAAAISATTASLLRARGEEAQRRVEQNVLTFVAGPTMLFLVIAFLSPALGGFQGFDDSHYLVGAQLTFQHGLWPWKNLYLLHGPLYDDLFGIIGMSVFSYSRWGTASGFGLIIDPLMAVSLYLFAAYFCRRNRLILIGFALALVLNLIPPLDSRWILLPPLIIVFDQVLKRRSWVWCGLFTFMAFIAAVLTPEVGLMVVGLLATLVVFELVHRRPGSSVLGSFYRCQWCVLWGLLVLGIWTVVLWATGALSAFIDYYITATPAHDLEGAFPYGSLTRDLRYTTELYLPVVLLLLTLWRAIRRLVLRLPWTTRDWVMLACASFVVLYYDEALDRIDGGHINEMFEVVIPLMVLWAADIVSWSDRAIRRIVRGNRAVAPTALTGVILIAALSPLPFSSILHTPNHYHRVSQDPPPATQPKLGYTVPGTVNVAEIDALQAVIDRYAGPSAPIYDLANEAGVTLYLLNRLPASRFYDIVLAQTEFAQQLVISDLKKSRPPVVIMYDSTFGLPFYDGITTMVREFDVSQYILDNYRPLLDVGGQLVMIRDDLAASAPPPPIVSAPISTSGLYFDTPSCNWGDVPDFFAVPPSVTHESAEPVPVRAAPMQRVTVSGWAFDTETGQPPTRIVVESDGRPIAGVIPHGERPDVARAFGTAALDTGYSISFSVTTGSSWTMDAVEAGGARIPITSSAAPTRGLSPSRLAGHVDGVTTQGIGQYTLPLPPGTDLASYRWMEITSPAAFGTREITLSDDNGAMSSHTIELHTLPRVGSRVYLQVGSCTQWHGYQTSSLDLSATGSPSPLSVFLLK